MALDFDPRYLNYFCLFQEEKFFEAHEVLEGLWRATQGRNRNFYQGLIQLAAMLVHFQKGNLRGAKELFKRASGYLRAYPSPYEGVDLTKLLRDFDAFLEAWERSPDRPPLAKRFLRRVILKRTR